MEPPLINDSTFSSTDPSLSEIWPFPLHSHSHFPPQINNNTSTKRNHSHSHSLSDNECSTKQHTIKLGIGGGGSSDDDAFKPQTDSTSSDAAPPKQQDYIHVRARRGQATDSHSLAERARREKISERMKILQDLVPGCNKVIGKALVLDEIINYIQSLQRQVEFLSMKLETVHSTLNIHPSIDCFTSKDHVGAQPFDLSGIIFGSQSSRGYAQGSQPGWIHMQIAGGFDKAT